MGRLRAEAEFQVQEITSNTYQEADTKAQKEYLKIVAVAESEAEQIKVNAKKTAEEIISSIANSQSVSNHLRAIVSKFTN